MSIAENLAFLAKEIPQQVKLVAVSKTMPAEFIREAYDAGQRIFGENRVQELTEKYPILPTDIQWHLIGHLQTNKIKYIAPFVSMIHSVDSFKLLQEINKEAEKNKRLIDCLMEFHIASEESKYGFTLSMAEEMLKNPEYCRLENVRICGVMGMATFTDNMELVRSEFRQLKNIFNILRDSYFSAKEYFNVISMGMSNDYHIAIEEGCTMIRLGTCIFGERHYSKQ